MTYEIYPNQEICNIIGKSVVIVDTLQINNGYITVENYHVPLSNILFIREVV